MKETIICVIRLFVFLPFITLLLLGVPLMYITGGKKPFIVWRKFNESVVFNNMV